MVVLADSVPPSGVKVYSSFSVAGVSRTLELFGSLIIIVGDIKYFSSAES